MKSRCKISMTKRIFTTLWVLCLTCKLGFGQDMVLSGTVKDVQGSPMPGVAVLIKGTTLGVVTQNDGTYSLSMGQADKDAVLVFSFLGFKTQELKWNGKTVIDVTLEEERQELEGVVVTALGIKREEKGLGYSTQTVTEKMMSDATPTNWASALVGKVAGANILSTSSGPISSARITLRGDASLNIDGNNALIVLDGVPLNSQMTGDGSNSYGAGGGGDVPVDYGNGIADINPNDIASIQVLKGATAAALYGSRAANGVMLVTTKSGVNKKKKYLGVTFNSNSSFDRVLHWPEFQEEYGQGDLKTNASGKLYYSYGDSEDGAASGNVALSFGPKLDGSLYYQYDPETQQMGTVRTPWVKRNHRKAFWQTGYTLVNSIAIDGSSEKSAVRLSLTYTKNEWIMPNTGFNRIAVSGSFQNQVTDKLRVSAKVNYVKRQSDNLPATGYNNSSIPYFMILTNPSVDVRWYQQRWVKGKEGREILRPFSPWLDNPYVIAYECLNPMEKHGVVATGSIIYEFSPKWELMIRSGIDLSFDTREMIRPYGLKNFPKGYYQQQDVFSYENNTDVLLTYRNQLSNSFNLSVSVGANRMDNKYKMQQAYVKDLITPGVYKLSNGVAAPITTFTERNKRVNSVYGTATLSYANKIFLDVTGRNDWSSTLPSGNNSFFYPSVSTSFILSDLLRLPEQISFAKLRASWAQVGNDTDPYKTAKYYNTSAFPGSASVSSTLYNARFKPEISNSIEVGLDWRMFKQRFGLDLAFYNNITRNQILDVPMDQTTGYTKATMNSGKVRNRGIELQLDGTPVKTKNFTWNSTFTWAKNYNKVLSLAAGLTDGQTIAYTGGTNCALIAKVGGSIGDIYGYKLKRAPDGQVVWKDGITARTTEFEYVGNAYPAWKAGFSNEFSYKNFRVSILFDGQWGGIVYSQTHHKMTEHGTLKHTLKYRENPNFEVVGEGVMLDERGQYVPNNVPISVSKYYADYWRRANVETNSFDASFLKLREARIEYTIPSAGLNKIGIERLTLALYGRNLAMWTKDFPVYDPEVATLNNGTIVPGSEMGQLPSTRTMGFNLTLKF
ncbi:SusC/RagA family TonB-linked outer membrane protein [Odoribacter splanchnicus]|uniref:SusC/RagA family TonB-linked outer membrane protein n=2 Tax=Odoribacter splanchnicus TaxID=28118 RepID=A0AAW5C5E8_9BACT|nr:SusC/RagA family TonB-linked outer membrane protein [Odoribacter splanchnicus]MBV4407215.1 SusC/RagA family TonB-linked outer membrane protein [Odoribacter splanchnicus]MCG4960261.1 SusC/RagA family TonB-linked outer membrane protein [Odoribacter splanchnicus]